MASLRRKPEPDAADHPAAVTIDPDPSSAPAPAPAEPSPFLREQLESLRQSETLVQRQAAERQRQNEIVAAANERRAAWLASNQAAQENYAALDSIHKDAVNSGLVDTSPQYFDYMNDRIAGLQDRQHRPEHLVEEMKTMTARQPEPQPVPSRGPLVSAPPSRDVASGYSGGGSRIRLTREQAEFAKMSGVSEAEYAKELLRLNQMKAEGLYQERR